MSRSAAHYKPRLRHSATSSRTESRIPSRSSNTAAVSGGISLLLWICPLFQSEVAEITSR